MRSFWPFALLAVACVDLTRPPDFRGPAVMPGSDDEAAVAAPADDSGVAERDAAGVPDVAVQRPDTGANDGSVAADAAILDVTVSVPDAPAADLAAVALDAAAPPDAVVAPDRAASPDRAPDVAPPVDLAPDRAPDLARDLAADLAADSGPAPLVVDDYQAALVTRNNLNSPVSWDHETCSRVNGESVCAYAGSGGFHDFIETFNNWCSFSAQSYNSLRFRLRTSAPGEVVEVYAGTTLSANACQDTSVLLGTITTTATMTTYSFDISALARTRWLTRVELDPQSTNSTQFILDDLQLVP
jgi:hypothetical protein